MPSPDALIIYLTKKKNLLSIFSSPTMCLSKLFDWTQNNDSSMNNYSNRSSPPHRKTQTLYRPFNDSEQRRSPQITTDGKTGRSR
jgi:hypothetical protein